MSLKIQAFTARDCTILHEDRLLLRYVAEPATPAMESPKSYFHPLHTLQGALTTDFAPQDHTWHHGVAFAPTYINDDTFWGGPSFVTAERDYRMLPNQGRQEHLGWEIIQETSGGIAWKQNVGWRSHSGRLWLKEERRIAVEIVDAISWRLRFHFILQNVSDQELLLASPVCRGRPEGGYFGLMWRGAPALRQGRILTAQKEGDAVMGARDPWLAYVAPSANLSLLFLDDPRNPRYPNAWFARCGDQPLVSYAMAYHEPYIVGRGESLTLSYQLLLADEVWDRAGAESAARKAVAFQGAALL